jgi:RNA polymerase sigma-70 factor (ECF subfamily)
MIMVTDIDHPVAQTATRNDTAGPHCRRPERGADGGALERQIEALIPRLTRFARALTHDIVNADDLVQESLARALAKLHLWQDGTDLRAWLFTILHHQHVSHVRRAAREGNQFQLSEWDGAPLEPSQGRRLELRDLERAINKLSNEQRSAILLVGAEEMQYDEAAALLNLPIGTVRSRVSRGRETLRILTDRLPGHASPRPGFTEISGDYGG